MKILTSKSLILILGLTLLTHFCFAQSSTTSAMNGKVVDTKGESLPGANVIAVHKPTGAKFAGITNVDGYYNLYNMNVGGPYEITVSFVGFKDYVRKNIFLNLGQTFRLDVTMSQTAIDLDEVIVSAKRVQDFRVIDGNRTGAETVVGRDQISALPSINRDLSDFTRLTPQASVRDDGAISIAGINNRYNSISVDGAVNNDVFGLSSTGTNGGQTGGTPFSMDAIEQFQVVLAPYDVRFSGFAGAGINAVTRSGTNKIEGSAYYYIRNESLAGKTPTSITKEDREKLPDFKSETYGFRFGGPIIKNKLFYFLSFEQQKDDTPQPFNFSNYLGNSTQDHLTSLVNFLKNEYNYNPGDYLNNNRTLESNKLFARIDWNISTRHKLLVRHSYTRNEALRVRGSSNYSINFYKNAEFFPSVTNSTALELKSNWEQMSNDLTVGFTSVRDDRDPYGPNFPTVRIYDGKGNIYFGSEAYSTANQLDQDVLTLTDNFTINKGKHTITVGTSNELSSTYNLFMRKNFGEYRYLNLDDFLNKRSAYKYERGYSLIPGDKTGDGAKAAAEFKMLQVGLYGQDEIRFGDNLKLTVGIRFDMPIFLDKPKEDAHFNTVTVPMLEAAGYDLYGARAGEMPKPQVLISPRIGFNWDALGDQSLQLRGGLGIFTSRLPLVWPGGSFTNNGITIGGVNHKSSPGKEIIFRPDWNNQYTREDFGGADAPYGGQIDLFAKDFKFPQVFRVNLAVDKKLPWNMVATLEGIYSKTLNNVLYYNVNQEKSTQNLTGADNRPIFSGDEIDDDYTRVILGTNTNEGYSYNITAQLQKPFDNGLTASIAYTYGRAKAINDGTSSQNSSQWRYMENVRGLNDLELSYSDFDLKSRIVGYVSYSKEYVKHLKTTISLFYNGQTGSPFSYVYYGDLNGDHERINSLIYVPASRSEINLIDKGEPGDDDYVSADQQWSNLSAFIDGDDYLKKRKGKYAERNAVRAPFQHSFDLKFAQDLFTHIGRYKHKLTLTVDIFNFTNLLNKDWGRKYYVGKNSRTLIDFKGYESGTTTPKFTFEKPEEKIDIYTPDDSGVSSSRWQIRLGVRYTF
ncbi:MAG: TonB-dependent receptor [Bacteroidales bacterium]|nr:TonB-dependent receptor [Bacteroidales bacterium]